MTQWAHVLSVTRPSTHWLLMLQISNWKSLARRKSRGDESLLNINYIPWLMIYDEVCTRIRTHTLSKRETTMILIFQYTALWWKSPWAFMFLRNLKVQVPQSRLFTWEKKFKVDHLSKLFIILFSQYFGKNLCRDCLGR